MADRKVYAEVKIRLIVRADQGVNINQVLDEMDYSFTSPIATAEIEDTEILDYDFTDSK